MVLEKRFGLAAALALACHLLLLALPGMRISGPVALVPQSQRVTIRLTAPPVAAPQSSKPVPISRSEPQPVELQVKQHQEAVRRQPRIPAQVPARETGPEPEPAPRPRALAVPSEQVPQQQIVNETAAPVESPVSERVPELLPTPPVATASSEASPVVTLAYPKYRQNPAPRYPAAARRRGQQGTVLLEVFVNAAGRVEEVRLAQSSGHSLLDRAARKTVRTWFFVPGMRGKKKIAMWVRVPVRFELHEAR